MPQVQASFFLGQRLVAQSSFTSRISQRSLAFLCLTCGEVWGRVMTLNDGKPGLWSPVPAPCEKHWPIGVQDWGKIPGGFLLSLDFLRGAAGHEACCLPNLPEALLQREFLLHLAYQERKLNDPIYST